MTASHPFLHPANFAFDHSCHCGFNRRSYATDDELTELGTGLYRQRILGWPSAGFANYGARPHAYLCEWDGQADDWSAVYLLSPVSDQQLGLAREDWDIWRRWELARRAQGLALEDKEPALAADWPRYEELRPLVDEALAVDKSQAIRAIPEFRGTLEPEHHLEGRWRTA